MALSEEQCQTNEKLVKSREAKATSGSGVFSTEAGGAVAERGVAVAAASVARSENARWAQQVASAASEASRIRREADRPKDVTDAASASAQY